jgi:hypothetical protein
MKITVIGTINKDLILPFRNVPIESFGGIFYDISILSYLLEKDDEIIPVSFIGEDIYPTVRAVLNKLPNVSRNGFIPVEQKNHKVILEYTSPSRRQEKSLFQFPPLTWEQIEPFIDSDMIILNMVSGWDIEEAAFVKLSETARSKLYLDIHYWVMGIDNLGRRFLKKPEGAEVWLSGSKFVQMNEDEYRTLADNSRNEVDFFHRFFKEDQILLITQGAKGAAMIYQRDGMVGQKHLPAWKVSRMVDNTGCGDAFGAGFVFKYLKSGKISESLEFANLVAAANLSLRGTNEMHRLKEMMDLIRAETEKQAGG